MADQHSFSLEKASVNSQINQTNQSNIHENNDSCFLNCFEPSLTNEPQLSTIVECQVIEDYREVIEGEKTGDVEIPCCKDKIKLVNQDYPKLTEVVETYINSPNEELIDNTTTSEYKADIDETDIIIKENLTEPVAEPAVHMITPIIDKENKVKKDKDKKKPFVCRFFLKGICNRGENCEYLHEKTQNLSLHQQMKETECPYFTFGMCHTSCSFRHSTQEESLCPEILPEWYLEFLMKKKIDRIFEDSEKLYLVEETTKLRLKVMNSEDFIYSKPIEAEKGIINNSNLSTNNAVSNVNNCSEDNAKQIQNQSSSLFNIKHESIINLLDNEKVSFYILAQEDSVIKNYLEFSVVFLKNPHLITSKDKKVVLLIFNSTFSFFLGFVELIENGKIYDKTNSENSNITFPVGFNYFMEIVWLWEWRTVTQKVNYLKSEGLNLKDLASEALVERDLGNKLCKFMMKRLTKEETVDLFKKYLSAEYNDSLLTFNNNKESKVKNVNIPNSISKCLSEIGITNLKHGVPGIPLPIPNIDTNNCNLNSVNNAVILSENRNNNNNINNNNNYSTDFNNLKLSSKNIDDQSAIKSTPGNQSVTISNKKALLGIKGLINKEKSKVQVKIELEKTEEKSREIVLKLKEDKLTVNSNKDNVLENDVLGNDEIMTETDKRNLVAKNLENSAFNMLSLNNNSNNNNNNNNDKHSLSSNLYSENPKSSNSIHSRNDGINIYKKSKHNRKRSPSIDHREIKERRSRHRKKERKESKDRDKDKDKDKDKDTLKRHKRHESRSRSRRRRRRSRSRSISSLKNPRTNDNNKKRYDICRDKSSSYNEKRREREREREKERTRDRDREYHNTNKYYIKKVYNNNLFYYNNTSNTNITESAKYSNNNIGVNNQYQTDNNLRNLDNNNFNSLSENKFQSKSYKNNSRFSYKYNNSYNKYNDYACEENDNSYFTESSSVNFNSNNNKNNNTKNRLNNDVKKEELHSSKNLLSNKRTGSHLSKNNTSNNKDQTILVSSKLFSKALSQIKETNC